MFQEIPVSTLQVSDMNVRKSALVGIDELAQNIKELAIKFKSDGLIHPLTVRKVGKKHHIIAGQRRFKAIEQINNEEHIIDKVKCLVISGKKDKDLLISLSENMFSQPMDPIDRFNTYSLMVKKGYTIGKIALAFGTSSLKVKQALAIADLHDDVIVLYRADKIRDSVLQHLTNLSHEQQLKITTAIEKQNYNFWSKNTVNDFLNRIQVNADHALFDLENCGMIVETDLFEENKFVTDQTRFMNLQRKAINELIKKDEENGFRTQFYDADDEFYSWEYNKVDDDEADPKTAVRVYCLESCGKVRTYNCIMTDDEFSGVDSSDNSTDSAKSEKPKRQELSKKDQIYFRDWQHTMACDALIKDKKYAIRFVIAKVIAQRNFSYESIYTKNQTEDEQLVNSPARKAITNFLDSVIDSCPKINPHEYCSVDFKDVLAAVIKLKEQQFKDLIVALAIVSLSPESSHVGIIGQDLKINALDYWKPDAGFVNHISSNPALVAVADVLIDTDVEKEAFAKLKIKDKKAKLAESLNPEFLPKYLEFPVSNYTGVKLDLESYSDWN